MTKQLVLAAIRQSDSRTTVTTGLCETLLQQPNDMMTYLEFSDGHVIRTVFDSGYQDEYITRMVQNAIDYTK